VTSPDGIDLTGEPDIFGAPWDPARWAPASTAAAPGIGHLLGADRWTRTLRSVASVDHGGGEQLAAVRGVVPTRADVAADVRRVVGGCRSRGDFSRLETPALDQLLALDGRSHDDGPELLARAIHAVDREQYRRFLEILLPFPFEEGERWPSLGPSRRGPGRGDRAAAVFGLDTWDGCTRPSMALDDRSRRDWAELHLASALLAVATGELAAPERSSDGARWRPRAAVLVAAAVGLVAIVAVVVALARRDDHSVSTAAAPSAASEAQQGRRGGSPVRVLPHDCVAIGALDAAVAAEPDAARQAATLQAVYERAGGSDRLGCGLAPAHRWNGLLVQEYEGEPDLPGAIVVTAADTGVLLDPAQWGSYRRVGAADGTQAVRLGGAPQRVVQRPDGGVEVELSHGVVMVAESPDAPYFWIYPDYVPWWRDHPELGLPAGNPLPSLTQDFQHGFAQARALGAEPEVVVVADPAAELPPAGERREHILHQADGTAWWIDASDRRHWIATARVWDCLGGAEVAYGEDVPGAAIATLPLAHHATCSHHD
jgi:hypothetical protein